MKTIREFDRFAASYGRYNIIQRKVARRLIDWVEEKDLGRILDLGCGTGEIYRQLTEASLTFDRFIGADLSGEMLALHPREERVHLLKMDFNDTDALRNLQQERIDTVFSSSALQWSRDLSSTLGALASLGEIAYLAIFGSETFGSLLELAGIDSPICDTETLEEALGEHYQILRLERVRYELAFESVREMFRYIKRSGVSGGRGRLSVVKMREVMRRYPHTSLEFEVLFCRGIPKGL